jgi:hypothetical protein
MQQQNKPRILAIWATRWWHACAIAIWAIAIGAAPARAATAPPKPLLVLAISPDPRNLELPATPVPLRAQVVDMAGNATATTGTWSLVVNGSGGSINAQTGLYSPGKRPGTDTIRVVTANGLSASINVVLGTAWMINAPNSLVLPAQPVQLRATDKAGNLSPMGPGTWRIVTKGSASMINASTGLYAPGSRPGTDTIEFASATGVILSTRITLVSPWTINPTPGTLVPPAAPIQFSAYTVDQTGRQQSGPGTWSLVNKGSGGNINAVTGLYTPGTATGTDTIRFTAADGLTASVDVVIASPWVISPRLGTVLASSAPTQFFAESTGGGAVRRYGGAATWTLTTNASGGTISAGTGAYAPGTRPGVDTILFTAAEGATATVSVTVVTSMQTGAGLIVAGGQKAAPTQWLAIDVTQRSNVATGSTIQYSASVMPGKTYVASLTGIVGAAQLKVFSDRAFTQPVTCLAPGNLANSTFAQPADCSFVATDSTVYVSVTGTSYLATDSNRYNLRISPRNSAAPAIQGTEQNPMVIQPDKPFAGTAGADYSYYKVTTAGTGDVVISLTGLIGTEDVGLHIYDNAQFIGPMLDNANCHTPQFLTFAESCNLPAGQTYYLEVRSTSPGGPFTLMVDSPAGATAPPVAAPTKVPNVINQALPAGNTAP